MIQYTDIFISTFMKEVCSLISKEKMSMDMLFLAPFILGRGGGDKFFDAWYECMMHEDDAWYIMHDA